VAAEKTCLRRRERVRGVDILPALGQMGEVEAHPGVEAGLVRGRVAVGDGEGVVDGGHAGDGSGRGAQWEKSVLDMLVL
jgi:hypothetical protein